MNYRKIILQIINKVNCALRNAQGKIKAAAKQYFKLGKKKKVATVKSASMTVVKEVPANVNLW